MIRITIHQTIKRLLGGIKMKLTRLSPLILAALISACATTGSDEQQSASTPQASGTQGSAATASGTDRGRVAGSQTRQNPNVGFKGAPSRNSVYFDYDQHDIKPEQRAVIEENAKYLRENPNLKARIEGNADERGSREYNLALGQRRAEVVMKTLNLLGIPSSRMEAVSFGEEKPRRTGHDEASWAENRRGDLVFEGK